MFSKAINGSLGVSTGLGLFGVMALVATLTSLFLIWSMSCLGGGLVFLATGLT